jgi:hypothetical protein
MDEQSNGHAERSIWERWREARDEGDPLEARRLLAILQEMRAGPPKPEDPDEHITPPRQPGTRRAKPRGGKRSIGKR